MTKIGKKNQFYIAPTITYSASSHTPYTPLHTPTHTHTHTHTIISNTTIPPWIMKKPQFFIDYLNINKSLNPSLIKSLVLEYIYINFPSHLQIFTDGSKLESKQTGAAFFIPNLKISNSYYLGKSFSIFTAELIGILEALKFINTHQINNDKILFCTCLLYTSPSPRDLSTSRMPSSA